MFDVYRCFFMLPYALQRTHYSQVLGFVIPQKIMGLLPLALTLRPSFALRLH